MNFQNSQYRLKQLPLQNQVCFIQAYTVKYFQCEQLFYIFFYLGCSTFSAVANTIRTPALSRFFHNVACISSSLHFCKTSNCSAIISTVTIHTSNAVTNAGSKNVRHFPPPERKHDSIFSVFYSIQCTTASSCDIDMNILLGEGIRTSWSSLRDIAAIHCSQIRKWVNVSCKYTSCPDHHPSRHPRASSYSVSATSIHLFPKLIKYPYYAFLTFLWPNQFSSLADPPFQERWPKNNCSLITDVDFFWPCHSTHNIICI